MLKIKNRPKFYNKPIDLKKNRLVTIDEEDANSSFDSMEEEINKEWGTYGDVVKDARLAIINRLKMQIENKESAK